MALIPTWYSASTKQIAEKALQRGVLKYPGLCYIQDSKSIAWVTIDNTLEYVKGDKQITDVKCIGSNLMFFSGDKLLFSYDISMTDEDKGHIIEEVKKTIGLDNYVKSSELSTLLDNIIGNLEDKSTVVDYINSLSYNKLFDVPIVNLIGTLTVPVKISSLDDGIYKVKGQCIIGGTILLFNLLQTMFCILYLMMLILPAQQSQKCKENLLHCISFSRMVNIRLIVMSLKAGLMNRILQVLIL